ncbi:MAG: hypothetical protein SH809_18605 [Rhodothermales bacterium]|nr:hypothetical protein [Rhodothermales bacterium]
MNRSFALLTLLLVWPALSGCQTLKEIANLRQVDFSLDRLSGLNLAGVPLDNMRSYRDLSAGDLFKLTTAVARRDLPLRFNLHVAALNPETNSVVARMVRMDWTLFLEDRETISGVVNQEQVLNPGQVVDIPVAIDLELLSFFDKNAQDLVDLVLSLSGQGGAPKNVRLQAVPVIDTVVGPIRYANPIMIVNREVG